MFERILCNKQISDKAMKTRNIYDSLNTDFMFLYLKLVS